MAVKEAPRTPTAPAVATVRDRALDILRGIAILEVITHHALSASARKFAEDGSWQWWVYVLLNRLLHFAVPTFLFVSALVLTKSLLHRQPPSWKRFYKRRAQRTLLPYLLWSFLFILFATYKVKNMPLERVYFGADTSLMLPIAFTNWDAFIRCFVYGKSYFHLYFMSVLLQMSLLFPLVYSLVRRGNQSFGFWLLLSLGFHAFMVTLQYLYRIFPYPASTIFWYVPPILLGAWLGRHYASWEQVWQKHKGLVVFLWGIALYAYLAVEIAESLAQHDKLPPLLLRAYPFSLLLFATTTALILLKASHLLNQHPVMGFVLARFGDRSLALFLLHPIVLHFLSGPRISALLDALPASGLWLIVLVMGGSWVLAEVLYRLRLNLWLFGREDQYGPLAPKPKHAIVP
jgi:peptidoglycan/LPS O-acetylase OafA/YrhL